jgi:hypothetical protein
MSAAVRVCVDTRPLERVEADLAVAGYFLDERPLRGPAGRADWRLCGAVSELVAAGRLRGKVGENVLVPSFGRLHAPRVLLLGLGRRASFRAARAKDTGATAVGRGLRLGARHVALAAPLVGTGELARHSDSLLLGVLDAVGEGESQIELSFVVPPEDESAARRSIQEIVDTKPPVAVSLRSAQ